MSRPIEEATEKMYRGLWAVIVPLLRVPREPPTIPVTSSRGGEVRSFQPAPGWLKYMKFWFWIVLAITDIGLAIGYVAAAAALIIEGLWWVAALLLPPALVLIIAPDIIAFIAIHLKYDATWYVMTDRSIRIRRGIISIRETTVTFENVQNVKVQQGPVQRHFGIADVIIETAGASAVQKGGVGVGNQARIEGVADAPALRDLILSRLKQSKSAGLGDEAQDARAAAGRPASGEVKRRAEFAPRPAWRPEHLEALRAIRDEARAVAAALSGR